MTTLTKKDLKLEVEVVPNLQQFTQKLGEAVGAKPYHGFPDTRGMRVASGALSGFASGGISGAVGGALGGLTAASPHIAIAKKVAEGIGQVIAGPLPALDKSLKSLNQPLGAFGGALDAMASIPGLGALGPAVSATKGILESIVGFSSKANPAVFQQLQLVLDDTMAVVGHSFMPVVELLRDGLRGFGDVLADILPSSGEVSDALQILRDTMAEIGPDLKQTLHELKPLITGFLIDQIKSLATSLSMVGRAFTWVAQQVRNFLRWLGFELPSDNPNASSTGAAVRRASLMGAEGYQARAQEAAFMMPGQRVEPAVRTNDLLTTLQGWLSNRWDDFMRFWNELPSNIWNTFRNIIWPRIEAMIRMFVPDVNIPNPEGWNAADIPILPPEIQRFWNQQQNRAGGAAGAAAAGGG